MTTIYLVRHGEAEGNAFRRIHGQYDTLLTPTGFRQTEALARRFPVKKIFVAKGRPQDNPLIVHVTGPEMLPGLVSEVPERAQLLMAAFCPGPLISPIFSLVNVPSKERYGRPPRSMAQSTRHSSIGRMQLP